VTEVDRHYEAEQLARILDLPPARLHAWARAGLLHPSKGTRGKLLFSFRDAVAARTIARLLSEGAPLKDIQKAVSALRGHAPSVETPLAEVRFLFDGGQVLFQDGEVLRSPSGQLYFDFEPPKQEGPALSPREVAESHFAAGCIAAWERREFESAERYFREAITHDPTFADAWCDLGTIVYELGRPDEARAAYLRALQTEPDHAEALCNLARLLLQAGNADIAADYLRRALASAPEFALAHLHAGVAYEALDQPASARAHLERALELEPGAPWADDALEALSRLPPRTE
jgi:tetratricopeptide (TPR) repeat protein